MNLAAAISLYGYGTSEGSEKGWDTRGRGRKLPDENAWSVKYKEEQKNAIARFKKGEKPLADFSDGKYRTVIMSWQDNVAGEWDPKGKGLELVFKEGDLTPVPTGKWMDWPEKSWGLSQKQYEALPVEQRARLEAKEQVKNWVPDQYEKEKAEWYGKRLVQ